MSTVLQSEPQASFADQLRQQTIGCKLTTAQMTARRAMSKSQTAIVAHTFGADIESVSGSRAALDRKNEYLKPIYGLILRTRTFVNASTIAYPEKGMRLIKVDRIDWMASKIDEANQELRTCLLDLDNNWQLIKEDAKHRLASLYSEADYPERPSAAFSMGITFPSIKPDERLLTMHPELYQREQERIRARFEEAVHNAEAAAADELGKLLGHFVERLTASEDGKPKTLKGSTLENIREFTERFRSLSIGSNQQLDQLVEQVEQLAGGLDITAVRKADPASRQNLKDQLADMMSAVDSLIIARPLRDIEID